MDNSKPASNRQKAIRNNLIITGVAGLAIGVLIAKTTATETPSPGVMIAMALLLPVVFIGSYIHYLCFVDEHDRNANLWSMSAGWITIIIMITSWSLLAKGNVAPPLDVNLAMGASAIVSIVVWAWLRFR